MIFGVIRWNAVNFLLTECLWLKANLNKYYGFGPFCFVMLGCHSVITCSWCWLFCHGELVLLHWVSVCCCTIVIRYFIFWFHLKHLLYLYEQWGLTCLLNLWLLLPVSSVYHRGICMDVLFSWFLLLICDLSSSCI